MSVLALLRQALHSRGDVLVGYRDRIAAQLTLLAVILITPFTLVNLVAGKWALGAVIAVTQVALVINLRSIQRQAGPVVSYELLAVMMTAAICIATHVVGLKGVFWAFPGLFIIYFIVERRLALFLGLVMSGVTTALIYIGFGFEIASRVGATLMLTMLMINVVINVIAELQNALVAQAITDPLTGAYNRRHFDSQVRGMVDELARSDPHNALLAIDIDHFKSINDRHGHDVGDQVLRKVVALVQSRKRKDDQLFRTGGEEFMLLLPGASHEAALGVAEELRERVAQAELLRGEQVTVSIGVSLQRAGEGGSRWIKRGDDALYQAKRNGRNRVEILR